MLSVLRSTPADLGLVASIRHIPHQDDFFAGYEAYPDVQAPQWLAEAWLSRALRKAGLEEVVFRPDAHGVAQSQLTAFRQWCEARTGRQLRDHAAMDRFSVEDYHSFWRLFLEWSDLPRDGAAEPVCVGYACETARFFPDLRLNYVECLLTGTADQPALTACHANGSRDRFTRGALRLTVARLAKSLQRLGVRPGDHVVAIARNNAEAVIACLATAAIGATFASCAPDMGVPAILARFAPLEPVVLFGCLRAEPWDAGVPVADRVREAAAGLPSLAAIIALDDGSPRRGDGTAAQAYRPAL